MEANKYGIISLILGAILFFGTYLFQNAGWLAILTMLFYGGLLWLGIFFILIGVLMLVL
ncbi:MAG: hypothetical protein V1717_01370 [Candidatus Micrarchaeota archaeon]